MQYTPTHTMVRSRSDTMTVTASLQSIRSGIHVEPVKFIMGLLL